MSLFTVDLESHIHSTTLLTVILACTYIEYAFELYLNLRQNKVYRTATDVPQVLKKTLDKETFEKARVYGKDKNVFSTFSDFYSTVVLSILLLNGGLYGGWKLTLPMLESVRFIWPRDWDEEIGRSMCFSILALIFNTVVALPLSIYSTFVLEEKHGFNKQTAGFFIKDLLKKIVVSVVIMTPIIGLIVKIVQIGGEYFFLYLWAFTFVILMFFMTIYPVAIAPLFDNYTPLKEGPLRARIEALASKIKFPLTKLYVVEGSKRSAHSNAYLYGFFNNKRIVLFDTLIKGYVSETKEQQETENDAEPGPSSKSTEKEAESGASSKAKEEEKGCTDEEIEAVLGHELGHWKLNHVVKNIVLAQVNMLFVFVIFAVLYQCSTLYEAFGFPKKSSMPVLIGLIIILQFILQIYNTAMNYIGNCLSRLYEFQADQFAVKLGYGTHLKSALIKLNKDNLGFPVCDPLYSAWHHSHPTILQRLAAIDDDMSKLK